MAFWRMTHVKEIVERESRAGLAVAHRGADMVRPERMKRARVLIDGRETAAMMALDLVLFYAFVDLGGAACACI